MPVLNFVCCLSVPACEIWFIVLCYDSAVLHGSLLRHCTYKYTVFQKNVTLFTFATTSSDVAQFC